MKVCPRCHHEFDEQLENCLVCGSELKEYDSILSQEEREVLELEEEVTSAMLEEIDPENLPEIICSVMGKEEGIRLSKLMQEHRIPCMCKENEEEEEVYDLYIPKKNFNKAIELLNEDEAALEQEECDSEGLDEDGEEVCESVPDQEPQKEDSDFTKMKRLFSWFFK